jgi:molybdopterin-containing oxidoreductase family iron-sulfur binding subunit
MSDLEQTSETGTQAGEPAAVSANFPQGAAGRRYWRSLEELADTTEFRDFLQREFPAGASELLGSSRRGFLKLMGASLALAGLGGCMRWPEQEVAPYAHRPANRLPGVPVTYATAFEVGGITQGILVESYDGRPTKVEGNPSHPLNKGAADALAQASVLAVYDPDRTRGVIVRKKIPPDEPGIAAGYTDHYEISWEAFGDWVAKGISADGAGLAILCEATSSPSVQRLRKKLIEKRPQTQWFEYEAVSNDNVRDGLALAFGQPLRQVLELAGAQVVVALDADLFGAGDPLNVKYNRDFAAARRLTAQKPGADARMNRLYSVESIYTLTGAQADNRRAARPEAVAALANQIAVALGVAQGQADLPPSGVDQAFADALIADLKAHVGTSVVVAGPRQPARVHTLVAQINTVLGNVGKTVTYYPDFEPQRPHHVAALRQLVEKLKQGAVPGGVNTLVILGGNPAYDAPADLDFAGALAKLKTSIHLTPHDNETTLLCTLRLAQTHLLEAWGDARTYDGTVSIVQPLIEPLFDGKSTLEVLSMLAGLGTPGDGGQAIVQATIQETLGVEYSDWKWKRALVEGVVADTAQAPWAGQSFDGPRYQPTPSQTTPLPKPASAENLQLVLFADGKTYGGRFANSGWLQELPDPMTRLTWDNAALIGPKTADKLGVMDYDVVELAAGDAKVQAPVYVMPGMADGTIGLALGYGRQAGGSICQEVGTNAYPLRPSAVTASGFATVTLSRTGITYKLATVQQHHIIDAVGKNAIQVRAPELIRERTLDELKKDPTLGVRKILALSVFDEHKFDGRVDGKDKDTSGVPDHDMHKWGMAIDLTSCTGCSACVVACQSENNIPIVGKEQVLHGREMHWIRVDRYFEGQPEAVGNGGGHAAHQPVLCMHCENAPCEEVCPVAATTHSQEGINMMTYNRCIGTRYCSNNCPYKVRRFNFFDYNRGTIANLYTPNLLRAPLGELLQMQKNPEVTVRMRGVMEKCTYCVQRIENTRIKAKKEGDRAIADGEIQTACQQSCPTQAITFGDLNLDGQNGRPESQVHKLHELARTYAMLDSELNTRPRTQYITKIRNPAAGLDSPARET